MIAQDEDWEAARETIFHSLLKKEVIPPSNKMCTQCGENKCTVRCTECLQTHQCFQCDAANHKVKMPFHIREDWIQGFYAPIPSGLSVKYEDEGEDEGMVYIPFRQYLPLLLPDKCRLCNSEEQLTRVQTDSCYIVVTFKGRYELHGQSCSAPHVGQMTIMSWKICFGVAYGLDLLKTPSMCFKWT
ncbi:uncharacterized protein [Amphiura filiformis]|uniref:uncharacterized protein n=1 Tax=Amphiura filiformis TaxID=82378 RepID=UPI003B220D2B